MKYIIYDKLVYELEDSVYNELKEREQRFENAKIISDDPMDAYCEYSDFSNHQSWIVQNCPCVSSLFDNYDMHRYDQNVTISNDDLPF